MSGEKDMSDNKIDSYKRRFLGQSAAIAGTAALGGGLVLTSVARARPADQAASSENRWGLLIDTSKCASDCDKCVKACEMEHGWGRGSNDEQHSSPEQKAQWMRKVTVRDRATGHETSLPMMCQHCAYPPCVDSVTTASCRWTSTAASAAATA